MQKEISIMLLCVAMIYFTISFATFIAARIQNRLGLGYIIVAMLLSAFYYATPGLLLFVDNISFSAFYTGPIRVVRLPLLYLYYKKLIVKNKNLKLNDLWHFVPLIVEIIYSQVVIFTVEPGVFFSSKDELSVLFRTWVNHSQRQTLLSLLPRAVCFVQGFVYFFLYLKLCKVYRFRLVQVSSFYEVNVFKQIQFMGWVFISFGLLSGFVLFGALNYPVFFIASMVFVVLMAFIIFIHAFSQSDLSETEELLPKSGLKNELHFKDKREFQLFIEEFTENKLYINPELTLQELSEKIKLPRYKITVYIKQAGYNNYYSFINHFRVNHSKQLLIKESETITIEAIGLKSGFSSRSTFFRVFKEITGLTPNQYLNSQME